jgi:hypothetical protein
MEATLEDIKRAGTRREVIMEDTRTIWTRILRTSFRAASTEEVNNQPLQKR